MLWLKINEFTTNFRRNERYEVSTRVRLYDFHAHDAFLYENIDVLYKNLWIVKDIIMTFLLGRMADIFSITSHF